MRVTEQIGAGTGNVTFAAGDDPVALGIHQPLLFRFQHWHQTAAGHHLGRFHAAEFEERRREVHKVHIIFQHTPARFARPPHRQRHGGAEVVQITFATRKSRCAVIAAHHHDGVIQLAQLLQPLENQPERVVEGLHFAEVIRKILTHNRHIRQHARQLALQRIRIDAPQLFT